MIPARIETIANENATSLETRKLRSVAAIAPKQALFAKPGRQPADWTLPAGGSVTVPIRLVNNHIILDVQVNGRGPFPFILDSGGHLILTPSTLKSLKVQSEGQSQAAGAGEKTLEAGYVKVSQIGVAGLALRDQTGLALDFSPLAVEGIQLAGMLGVELFERFVVEIDYGAGTLTISDPALFDQVRRNRSGTPVPIRFYDHMPQVAGLFEGRPARFNIDTGARNQVTLTSPYVATAKLLDGHPGAVTVTDGWGVGGPSRSTVVRATSLSLGPVKAMRPIAGLSTARHGSFSDPGYEGNIGTGFLKRYVVTFDYSRGYMYLRPTPKPDADIGRFDRSGMWINLGSGGVEITDIAAGGPAEAAGLRVGDVITAIGGSEVSQSGLSDLRRMLRLVSTDKPLAISYRRGPAPAQTALLPRDIVPD